MAGNLYLLNLCRASVARGIIRAPQRAQNTHFAENPENVCQAPPVRPVLHAKTATSSLHSQ
ncbi:hypothetical protein HC928_13940 [bacterium]|nr:hypothetical protein [bacterium]